MDIFSIASFLFAVSHNLLLQELAVLSKALAGLFQSRISSVTMLVKLLPDADRRWGFSDLGRMDSGPQPIELHTDGVFGFSILFCDGCEVRLAENAY
jgi:hypothetical protein